MTILVVWCTRKKTDPTKVNDHYVACENYAEARAKYDKLLLKDNLHSANICAIMASTDYTPMSGWNEESP